MNKSYSRAEIGVTAFHLRNGYKVGDSLLQEWCRGSKKTSFLLRICSFILEYLSKLISKTAKKEMIGNRNDARLYRSWLMIEELQEVIDGLRSGNEIMYADGLGDLLYVVVGSAVTNNIPLQSVFEEIQNANMKKKQRTDDDIRMRNKGLNWKRPNIGMALDLGRLNMASLITEAQKEVEKYADN